ncbi:hypothetical protein D1AOALGA4SA_11471 [Olavius algarvensis Delta 1 endosymbiont]|nr:hypothetical protein D1AOALGA4SA_11471 [Olavius algarvensis Delta 1 endosymbiont]
MGNTASIIKVSLSNPVHPHACGEHIPAPPRPEERDGSSPRLWGTRAQKI